MLDRFLRANNRFTTLAEQIPAARFDETAAATPDWTFKQLIEHIIENNYATATSLTGITQPATDDGVELLTTLRASTEAANQAAAGETDHERIIKNQYGNDMSVEDLLTMGLTDRGLHYWDLAVSLGLPAEDYLDDEDAGIVYRFVMPTVEDMRAIKAFGPEVAVPAEASVQARLLGATGRDPVRSVPVRRA